MSSLLKILYLWERNEKDRAFKEYLKDENSILNDYESFEKCMDLLIASIKRPNKQFTIYMEGLYVL